MNVSTKLFIVLCMVIGAVLLSTLSPILTPFLIGALFAYLGNPLVNRLVRWRIPRTLAVICVFTLFLLVIILLVSLLIPVIETQISLFVNKLPAMVSGVQNNVLPWLHDKFDLNFDAASVKSSISSHWQQAGNVADKIIKTISLSGVKIFTFLVNLILIPVVTFYLLRDWPKVITKTAALVPRKAYPTLSTLLSECDEVLGAFFRGQLMVMIALGVVYSTGLAIIGLDLAVLIGLLIAVFSIVPYLGTIIGLLVTIIATLYQFHDVIHLVYVGILFVIGHLLEGMVLTPLFVGDRIGLHPVAVIFAILAGGQLFGFLGVLLALPVAAVIMVWARFAINHYLNSRLYHH